MLTNNFALFYIYILNIRISFLVQIPIILIICRVICSNDFFFRCVLVFPTQRILDFPLNKLPLTSFLKIAFGQISKIPIVITIVQSSAILRNLLRTCWTHRRGYLFTPYIEKIRLFTLFLA